jgi:hypothetical protein
MRTWDKLDQIEFQNENVHPSVVGVPKGFVFVLESLYNGNRVKTEVFLAEATLYSLVIPLEQIASIILRDLDTEMLEHIKKAGTEFIN